MALSPRAAAATDRSNVPRARGRPRAALESLELWRGATRLTGRPLYGMSASPLSGPRDAAIIAVLLYSGARAEECARLDAQDVPVTARTGKARLHGKGDEVRTVPLPAAGRERVSAWLLQRGSQPGPLWTGQRGPLSVSGITQAVLATGADAGLPGLRPHRLRGFCGTVGVLTPRHGSSNTTWR